MSALWGDAPAGAFLDRTMRRITLIDGTSTAKTKVVDLHQGSLNLQNIHRFQSEPVDVELGTGAFGGTVGGAMSLPTAQIDAAVDTFSIADVLKGTVQDFLLGTAATLYAARVSTRTNSRYFFFHTLIEYLKDSSTIEKIALEHCRLGPAAFVDETQGQINMPLVITGRVFMGGKLVCAPRGAATTLPTWAGGA
jgi:hypothetical protein